MVRFTEANEAKSVVWVNALHVATVYEVNKLPDGRWTSIELINGVTYSVTEDINSVVGMLMPFLYQRQSHG